MDVDSHQEEGDNPLRRSTSRNGSYLERIANSRTITTLNIAAGATGLTVEAVIYAISNPLADTRWAQFTFYASVLA